MSRPRRFRRVLCRPEIINFQPRFGSQQKFTEVNLGMDELEAMRLKDFAGLEQHEAAKKMDVSTSTFQRILYAARKKVVDALLYGKAIRIIEGKGVISMPAGDGTGPLGQGPVAGGGRGLGRGGSRGRGRGRGFGQRANQAGGFGGPAQNCVCPSCNTQVTKKRGLPCASTKCSQCGTAMVRGA